MRIRGTMSTLTLTILAALIVAPAPVLAADPACSDVQLVYARGTDVPLANDPEYATIRANLTDRLANSGLSLSSQDLGEGGGYGGYAYPANGGGLGFLTNWSLLDWFGYAASRDAGIGELDAYLSDRAATCPNEVYVLAGWSQGAHVIGDALAPLSASIQARVAGNAYVTWYDGVNAQYPSVWGAAFLSATHTWTTPEQISDQAPTDANLSPATALGTSTLVALWGNDHSVAGGGFDVDIFAKTEPSP